MDADAAGAARQMFQSLDTAFDHAQALVRDSDEASYGEIQAAMRVAGTYADVNYLSAKRDAQGRKRARRVTDAHVVAGDASLKLFHMRPWGPSQTRLKHVETARTHYNRAHANQSSAKDAGVQARLATCYYYQSKFTEAMSCACRTIGVTQREESERVTALRRYIDVQSLTPEQKQSYGHALHVLGRIYYRGYGVTVDRVLGYHLMAEAAKLGQQDAQEWVNAWLAKKADWLDNANQAESEWWSNSQKAHRRYTIENPSRALYRELARLCREYGDEDGHTQMKRREARALGKQASFEYYHAVYLHEKGMKEASDYAFVRCRNHAQDALELQASDGHAAKFLARLHMHKVAGMSGNQAEIDRLSVLALNGGVQDPRLPGATKPLADQVQPSIQFRLPEFNPRFPT